MIDEERVLITAIIIGILMMLGATVWLLLAPSGFMALKAAILFICGVFVVKVADEVAR